jgi:hypothetical protein
MVCAEYVNKEGSPNPKVKHETRRGSIVFKIWFVSHTP